MSNNEIKKKSTTQNFELKREIEKKNKFIKGSKIKN